MRQQRRDGRRDRESAAAAELEAWVPKTALGKKVKSGEITSIDEILDKGMKILEPQIVSKLLPDLKEEVLDIRNTQRMTASGRKQKMEAVVALGNKHGYIALGMGKAVESRDAIAEAISNAKKHIMRVRLGCGSWECGCGTEHTVPREVVGKSSSTTIIIRPAPRGVGLVAGGNTKKVLALAGISDAWTFAKGRTRNVLNMILATMSALDSLNSLKAGKGENLYGNYAKKSAIQEPVAAEVAEGKAPE